MDSETLRYAFSEESVNLWPVAAMLVSFTAGAWGVYAVAARKRVVKYLEDWAGFSGYMGIVASAGAVAVATFAPTAQLLQHQADWLVAETNLPASAAITLAEDSQLIHDGKQYYFVKDGNRQEYRLTISDVDGQSGQ